MKISLFGVPLHCWRESFKSLGNGWGSYMDIDVKTIPWKPVKIRMDSFQVREDANSADVLPNNSPSKLCSKASLPPTQPPPSINATLVSKSDSPLPEIM
ncbi:hypothetical protein V6N11_002173 [Hibiscus sabdariffa]|uniref:DUF4283 domain-containing protein n=1 Tax=Hibiscus sabdariffa TaxID=183260 RepID=A0ABR2QV81_9ROSI